jgi:hypothetical protein
MRVRKLPEMTAKDQPVETVQNPQDKMTESRYESLHGCASWSETML